MDSIEWLSDAFAKFLKVINTPFLDLNQSKVSISSVVVALFVIFLSFRLAKILGRAVHRALTRKAVNSGVADSLERFTRYLTIAGGILFSLDMLGISITSLAALSAVLMVGVGFGLQNITQNFISGIILLIERPVKVGDIIHVGSSTGRITDIHVRSTIIQTRDDVAIIVPNSKLVSEDVVNDSFTGNYIRQHVKVGVAYGSDVEKVRQVLLEQALSHARVLKTPEPTVVFENFGESSLDFDLRYWSEDIWAIDVVSSDLRFSIDAAFRKHGIQIPFPQRDVHLIQAKP
ncbi:MAG: mechanosensitive ion channel family protein [Bdellovibrionales bacterium]